MANKQIGWSKKANLLVDINKKIIRLMEIAANNSPSTTTTSTTTTP